MSSSWFMILAKGLIGIIVPVIVLGIAWRKRDRFPQAARLAAIAVGCQFLQVCLMMLVRMGLFGEFNLSAEDGELPGVYQKVLFWQLLSTMIDIIGWSCVAWAILMRPDERRRQVVV